MNASARVVGVHAGPVARLGPGRVRSAFVKRPVTGRIAVDATGLAGDAQADPRVHGGPDKAVYAYPAAAYAAWAAAVPRHAARFVAGAMGENLTIDGWSDADVAIGDRVRIGSAILEVSEPRTPCFKLGLAFGDAAMVRAFMAIGVSGWYYRVVEPGTVATGDAVVRVGRGDPAWTIARFFRTITAPIGDDDLRAIAALAGVADGWRDRAETLLRQRATDRRAVGPEGFEPPTKPL